MKRTLSALALGGLCATLAATPASSHHSFAAEFDADRPVTLSGIVTRIDWRNPHAFIYLDVADEETDQVTNWAVELGSPNGLRRLGWRRNSVQVGDELTIEGTLARFKPHLANARSAILAGTGEKLGASSSEPDQ